MGQQERYFFQNLFHLIDLRLTQYERCLVDAPISHSRRQGLDRQHAWHVTSNKLDLRQLTIQCGTHDFTKA